MMRTTSPPRFRRVVMLTALLGAGCSKVEPPKLPPAPVSDVKFTTRSGEPIASIFAVPAGSQFEVVLSFKAEPQAAETDFWTDGIKQSKDWEVTMKFFDHDDDSVPRYPVGRGSSLLTRHPNQTESTPGRSGYGMLLIGGREVYRTPSPPEKMRKGYEYYFGQTWLPREAGVYDLEVHVHPAPEPNDLQRHTRSLGRSVPLYKGTVTLTEQPASDDENQG